MASTLSIAETALLIRVSEEYLVNTIVPTGELRPIAGTDPMQFDETEVRTYVQADIARRKAALRQMAQEESE